MAKHKLGDNEQLREVINDIKRFDKAEEQALFKKHIKNPLWQGKRLKCRTKAQGVLYGDCKGIKPLLEHKLQIAFTRFVIRHQDILRYEIDNRRIPHLKRTIVINTQFHKNKWWECVKKTINNTMLKDKVLTQQPFEYFLDFISAGRLRGVTRDLNDNEALEFFTKCCEVLNKHYGRA